MMKLSAVARRMAASHYRPHVGWLPASPGSAASLTRDRCDEPGTWTSRWPRALHSGCALLLQPGVGGGEVSGWGEGLSPETGSRENSFGPASLSFRVCTWQNQNIQDGDGNSLPLLAVPFAGPGGGKRQKGAGQQMFGTRSPKEKTTTCSTLCDVPGNPDSRMSEQEERSSQATARGRPLSRAGASPFDLVHDDSLGK